MKQQRQLMSKLAELLLKIQEQLLPKNSMESSSSTLRNEFAQVIKVIQIYFAEAQREKVKYLQELTESTRKLRAYQSSIKQMNQELQRLRLLLPIKEQLITSCKKEISVLHNTLKQSMPTTTSKRDKPIDEFAVSRVFEEVQLGLKEQQTGFNKNDSIGLGQTKPKILFKKNADETYKKDLEIARLKNETCKLGLERKALKADLELLKIQNTHLLAQLQTYKQQQLFANNFITKLSNKELNTDLTTKCEKLQSYIDKLTSKLQKIQINQAPLTWSHRIDLPLHPPTPHFSGGNFGFGHKQKIFEFPQVLQINESIISMGESVSEGLQ